jgi:hypothetical protein
MGHRQVVGWWIVKGAMDRSTVVGRRDHAAMATPVTVPKKVICIASPAISLPLGKWETII